MPRVTEKDREEMIVNAYRQLLLLTMLLFSASLCAENDSIVATRQVDEVEVRAVRTADQLSLNPRYTIDNSRFLALNITDIASAMRRLPGVNLRDYGGAGGMKTVSVRGLGAQHTGVVIDGLLVSDLQSGQIDLQQFGITEVAKLSLDMMGSDDIFAPARNLSGSSLLAITTNDSVSNVVRADLGSWDYLSLSAKTGKRFRQGLVSLQGGYTQAENDYPFTVHNGIATHRERRNNSALKQGYANLSSQVQLASETILRLLVRFSDDDRELPGIVRLYTNENDETLRDRSAMAQSVLTTRLANRLWMKSALRWNWTEQSYHNGIPSGGIKSEHYAQREYYATTALLWRMVKNVDVDYSADFFYNELLSTLKDHPRVHRNTFMQSASAKWTTERMRANLQLLNSNVDDERRVSPMFSVSLKPFKDWDLYLRMSAKSMFRMPTMTELYYYHIGSQTLKPETTKQLNLGITWTIPVLHRLEGLEGGLSADLYINKVEDKIVCIPFNMFVSRFMNLDKVNGCGADIMANISYETSRQHRFLLTTNYSLQRISNDTDGGEHDGMQVAYTPLHSGSNTLAWENKWLNASATVAFASHTWTTNEHHPDTRIPGYAELSASLYRDVKVSKRTMMNLSVTCQNILDEDYCIVAHYPMPGRNWKISITYKF